MSGHCKSCMINAPMKNADPKRYESWHIKHKPTCNINYIGSTPNMESTGALSIFKSLENYGLRYLNYYGDGDSKSFQSVENVYEGAKVVKCECIGHYYKKRDRNRLRKLCLRVKGLGG